MDNIVDIYIPTLNRPHKIEGIISNINESTKVPHEILFIADISDKATQDECQRLKANLIIDDGCYASAINKAYSQTSAEWFFIGADDVKFYPDWLEIGTAHHPPEMVVVPNDLHNPSVLNKISGTFFLVRRKYIEDQGGCVDKEYKVLYPYKHNFCDTEFYETAKQRGVLTHDLEMKTEHMHYCFGLAQNDSTYEKGQKYYYEDTVTFNNRRQKWSR